jgi:hypothetical protein
MELSVIGMDIARTSFNRTAKHRLTTHFSKERKRPMHDGKQVGP